MKNRQIDVVKKNANGVEVFRYHGQIVGEYRNGIVLQATFSLKEVQVQPDLSFVEGDRFLEFYPFDQWFNIYQVHHRDTGVIKGWYCNICRPPYMNEKEVAYEDLELDLLVYPDGKQLMLDQAEFAALEASQKEKKTAESAMQTLRSIFSDFENLDIARTLFS